MSTYASQGRRRSRHCLTLVTALALIAAAAHPRLPRLTAQAALRIIVLEGEDAVNVIDKKTAVKPAVEVRDRNDLPVAGALVRFAIRSRAAAFNNGVRELSVTTDSLGRAAVSQLTPLGKGAIEIHVSASFQGQAAAATIHQTNVLTLAEAAQAGQAVPTSSATAGGGGSGGGLSGTTIAAIAGGAAAGAVAIAAVARGEESPPQVARAQLDVSITPNPTTYGQCVHPSGPGAPYQLTIRELAGVAFTIESITLAVTYINAAPQTSSNTGTFFLPAFTFCDPTSGSLTLNPRGTLCTRQC